MLRFNILASVVPLAVAAVFARGELLAVRGPASRYRRVGSDCRAVLAGRASRQFHQRSGRATVRVQISESAEAADFAVIDDVDSAEAGACQSHSPPQLVAISSTPSESDPVIYLHRTARPITASSCIRRVFGARCRRPDRRRPRRSATARCAALVNASSPCSHRGQQRPRPQALCNVGDASSGSSTRRIGTPQFKQQSQGHWR